ncbi:MAG: arginine--tRNA ligase [Deltaproteobacteria bacterium]|nr:arginine--tRNA ligase [Deltaproteobacteria bacterium]
MRLKVHEMVGRALVALDGVIKTAHKPDIVIEKSKKEEFGDFATNIAMSLGPLEKRPPREIAEAIVQKLRQESDVAKCEVAGPGFINIFLHRSYWGNVLADIIAKGGDFGASNIGNGKKVNVEFVSANPTGPLHVGHGRGAAVGDALARILEFAGYAVTREFYVNDRGKQIKMLGESVRLRYKELIGEKVEFPQDFYKGEYIKELADPERLAALGYFSSVLTEHNLPEVFLQYVSEQMLAMIRQDLLDFRVSFNVWQSEKALFDDGKVMDALAALTAEGRTFTEEGALWFKTTAFGDDKDRVLRKADGELTYLSSDVAYHKDKAKRGFDTLINVWGADHHGYEARVRAALKALGYDDAILKVIFIQLVALLRNGAPVPMGKREGEFVTLRQVMDEVGVDACRFFFLMRKSDAHLDFDLELAKSQAPENPVYYVQYCHARIHSILEFAATKGFVPPDDAPSGIFEKLVGKDEIALIKHLAMFEEVVEKAALTFSPHLVAFYLMELAGMFHPYYNRNRVVTDDEDLTKARLLLCKATATVAANGLKLLGVSAPVKM